MTSSPKKNLFLLPLLLAALTAPSRNIPAQGPPQKPNVLLITLDTTRADHLACYGHPTAETPTLDGLAARGVLFEQAITPIPVTDPAHITLFTGLSPDEHGVYENGIVLEKDPPTLAGLLAANGYDTAAFVSVKHLLTDGYLRGFKTVDGDFSSPERFAEDTTDRALRRLEKTGPAPFFLWVHYFDPHAPYFPPERFRRERSPGAVRFETYLALRRQTPGYLSRGITPEEKTAASALLQTHPEADISFFRLTEEDNAVIESWYLGEIAHVDSQLSRIVSLLQQRRLLDDTVVILVGDHGETLRESSHVGQRFRHGSEVYDRQIRVPLIISYPKVLPSGRRIAEQVRLADVLPTLLGLLGIENKSPMDGVDVLASAAPPDLPAYSYSVRQHFECVRTNEFKLLRDGFNDRMLLFDLKNDPAELTDVKGRRPDVFSDLSEKLARWKQKRGASLRKGDVDPHVLENLKDLGYLR